MLLSYPGGSVNELRAERGRVSTGAVVHSYIWDATTSIRAISADRLKAKQATNNSAPARTCCVTAMYATAAHQKALRTVHQQSNRLDPPHLLPRSGNWIRNPKGSRHVSSDGGARPGS